MKALVRLARRVKRRLTALIPEPPPPPGLPLTVVEERAVLTRVADPMTGPMTGPTGVIGPVVEQSVLDEPEARARLEGRSGGVDIPAWADGAGGVLRSAVDLVRVADVWHAPAFGVVFDQAGRVFKSSAHEALYLTPTLAALPGARREGEATVFVPPADAPTLPRATVFMAWGGLHNYGHFLIDCLPALLAAEQAGALSSHPPVAPPLSPWQAELLTLLGVTPTVIDAPVARLGEAVFTTPMDHFLHAPGPPLNHVRERILAAAALADSPSAPKRIYVSRLGTLKRVLVNEAELEAALAARGFAIVRPETLSVRDQIALFHHAETIVAPAGAAMANALFCKPGATLVEIQPSNFTGVWVRNIALLAGVGWRGFFAPSPLSETEIVMEGQLRPASEFRWRLDLPGFLAFLDGAL